MKCGKSFHGDCFVVASWHYSKLGNNSTSVRTPLGLLVMSSSDPGQQLTGWCKVREKQNRTGSKWATQKQRTWRQGGRQCAGWGGLPSAPHGAFSQWVTTALLWASCLRPLARNTLLSDHLPEAPPPPPQKKHLGGWKVGDCCLGAAAPC